MPPIKIKSVKRWGDFHSYVAGLFDGEGSISIIKTNRKDKKHWAPIYVLVISLSQKYKGILNLIKEYFGGIVVGDGQGAFQWRLSANRAADFLEDIYDLLLLKKLQAEVAINFQKNKKVIRLGNNGFIQNKFPLEELNLREGYWKQIKKIRKQEFKYAHS